MTPTSAIIPRLLGRLAGYRTRLRDRLRGETRATFFDIHNFEELNEVLCECGRAPLAAIPHGPPRGLWWKAALAYQFRPDIRDAIPLGLTPAQRRNLLVWLLRYGANDLKITDEDVLWGVLAMAADPSHGLRETYRLQPAWQVAVPDALTPSRWPELRRWVAGQYGLDSRWIRTARLPAGPPPAPADVLAVGLFRYSSGLQQAGVGMVQSLRAAGVRVACRDLPGAALREHPPGEPLDALATAPVALFNLGLDTSIPEAARRAGLHLPPAVRRIAVWWWELEQVPPEWAGRGDGVDEIWAPTRFIADSLRRLGKPVFPMLPGLEPPRPDAATKAAFGMSSRKWTFVGLFDANSSLVRKNPLGAVRAFRAAFGPSYPVELILKMTPPTGAETDELRQLRRECGEAGVRLIEAHYTRGETLAFLAAADSLVSLHRSEGFGLPLAEAMLLGKPVIGTAYSGNLDFMTWENSVLVECERVPIAYDDPPYRKGMVWAEPSIESAAAAMRRLAGDPQAARRLGLRAQAETGELLSLEAAGARMRRRLDEIAGQRA